MSYKMTLEVGDKINVGGVGYMVIHCGQQYLKLQSLKIGVEPQYIEILKLTLNQ